jgi:hypothetical protein
LTKDNRVCLEAIRFYQKTLIIAFADTQKKDYELNVNKIFKKILMLSLQIKFQIPELKKQIEIELKNEKTAI